MTAYYFEDETWYEKEKYDISRFSIESLPFHWITSFSWWLCTIYVSSIYSSNKYKPIKEYCNFASRNESSESNRHKIEEMKLTSCPKIFNILSSVFLCVTLESSFMMFWKNLVCVLILINCSFVSGKYNVMYSNRIFY